MADKDLWTTFEKTGSVLDYLSYKGVLNAVEKEKTGERAVESGSQSNRDDIVRSSYWGV